MPVFQLVKGQTAESLAVREAVKIRQEKSFNEFWQVCVTSEFESQPERRS